MSGNQPMVICLLMVITAFSILPASRPLLLAVKPSSNRFWMMMAIPNVARMACIGPASMAKLNSPRWMM